MEKTPKKTAPPGALRIVRPASQMSRTAVLVECAMMVALGFVLSIIPFFHLPWGGSVTCFSTLPIIVMSFRHGMKWGVASAAVFGAVHALMGANSVAAAGSFGAMLLCALLDYILAYAAVGLTGPVAGLYMRIAGTGGQAPDSGARQDTRGLRHPRAGLVAGIVATGLMRLLCSFLSGVLIWGAWAPEGVPVWQYSLTYNAGWCLPDVAIVLFAALALSLAPGMQSLGLSERRGAR